MFFNYEIGDYLLHPRYGIGKFIKIEYIFLNNSGCDFLKLEYLNDASVFIPTYNIGILKFHSDKDSKTQIDQLEKSKILKKKHKVQEEIEKTAKELMQIALLREEKKVLPMLLNVDYEKFCNTFPFKLTKGQERAIKDIEKDLSITKPMDRLLCGDVGFGKTEVAARAIAITLLNGQKALFVVPTTILALQHYNVLKERFSALNKRCELYSKLSDQDFKKDWQEGKIDILISTIHHKYMDSLLISDLGLVVLDEEHHFGVKFKEKIRERTNFLQLSATPIPRTLHLALSNIKDISVLEEPPYNKQNTEINVLSIQDLDFKKIILDEMERGGKIFIVVPRIQFLDEIKKMLTFTDYVVLHGKLSKEEIKSAFDNFSKEKIHIMLATNIIESGIDIASANLMIVFYAHMFGIAQLHQLKGRVGRGENKSVVYFIMPKMLTDIAMNRLNLIKENAVMGCGFNLSIKDMELRGSGTVVGTKQSGKDYGFGLESYYDMLSQALGKKTKDKQYKNISWVNFGNAYIPETYIKDDAIRIAFYKKLSVVNDFSKLSLIIEDFKDFGELTNEIINYLIMIKINILTKYFEITRIIRKGDKFDIFFKSIDQNILNKIKNHFMVKDNKILDVEGKRLEDIEKYFNNSIL